MKYRELARKLESLGCYELKDRRTRGSHRKWINPFTDKVTSIPYHKELKLGTARACVRQLSINWSDIIHTS